MKKSALLEKIIEKAEQLSRLDSKDNIDCDYFVLATISICFENSSIEGVNETEIQEVKELCENNFVDCKSAYSFISNKAKETPKSFVASLMFHKAEIVAETQVKNHGGEEVGAQVILSTILKEPTSIMKEWFENLKDVKNVATETPEVKDTDSQKPVSDLSDSSAVSSEQEEGVELFSNELNLTELIKKVKNAQKSLLESVRGQDHAVNNLIAGYYQAEIISMTQRGTNKPKATFLFAGPPGVGKTFLAEQTAKVLDMPFMRFDMSEYSEKEANLEFCGSDKVYKNGKEGNVTGFVAKNPKSILLFDEIEKAHLNVIHLFLQILDAGRVRDNYTDEEVSFADTILIFTTNAGRKLYEDTDIQNLSTVSRKQVLNALSLDLNPITNAPLFPTAICSRFAAGNVIMFNRLGAHDLIQIAQREFNKLSRAFKMETGIEITLDRKVLYALLFAEGGNVDARTVRGRTSNFFCQETYELFRLMTADEKLLDLEKLENIKFDIEMPSDERTSALFKDADEYSILVFASDEVGEECKKALKDVNAFCVSDIAKAKEVIFNNNISLILCDIECGINNSKKNVLNLEDVESLGSKFFEYSTQNTHVPTYIFEQKAGTITQEEVLSFMRNGARGVVSLNGDKEYDFLDNVLTKCNIANQQNKLLELARLNKILSFKTEQQVSAQGKDANITLFDFKLDVAPDVNDSKNILSAVSKPTTRFDDVIGAQDAKGELAYFVDYLKDPISYMRKGVRAPKGILLYGPPGTGKTLLAKAMAGESDVTFIAAEGNSFLKKYVGEGSEKVHELFRLARKYAPSILFIDEIDSIGKDRNIGGGSENNSADVLTAFLTEMDGFKTQSDKPVFVLAATNYDIEPSAGKALDAALLRRFDRKILVDLPNKPEREKFIRLKASKNKNIVLSDEQIDNIAIRSTNMSLADLESIFELALRDAIKSKDYVVNDGCFENAFESYNSGEVKKWDISELERTARHEAGHALLCWLSGETPSYLTIVARGSHGGYMQHGGNENKGLFTKEELLSRVRTSLAGRAAEVVYYGETEGISTGASGDLQSATRLIEQMICVYGMDETIGLSTINFNNLNSDYYSKIRDRVNQVLSIEFEKAKNAISKNIDVMNDMVQTLMEKNHLKGNEIEAIFSKGSKK